jgi:hypothetical protein
MDGLAIITGIAITAFLLLYFAFNLEKKHYLLQVFTIGYVVFLIILIPATTVDLGKDCGINSTGGYYCYTSNGTLITDFEDGNDVGTTFLRSYYWFVIVFSLYLFTYFIAAIFMWWQKKGGSK